MLFSLSFNGIKKDYLICERGKRRSAFAPIKRNLLPIEGMPGAYLESTDTEVRVIQQPITINAKDRMDERKLEEDLSAWLITGQPAELIFDEEPDRVYYAVIDGSLDIEDIARFGKGTITFICPDPYKYGTEEKSISWPELKVFKQDFAGKVSGSIVGNPHIFKRTTSGSNPNTPSDFTYEGVSGEYAKLSKLDGDLNISSKTVNGESSKYLFSFDLIAAIERRFGAIPAADKVAWLKANIKKLTANWHGKGSNKMADPNGKADFAGKIAGSITENPHLFRYRTGSTLTEPSNSTEAGQGSYDLVKTLNGSVTGAGQTSGVGFMAQQVFSFNLIEYIKRKYGYTPTAQWLRDNAQRVKFRWFGKGSGPSGNRAYLKLWADNTKTWDVYKDHASGSITELFYESWSFLSRITNDGFIHFLTHAEASNGTIASTIETDYVELEVELKPGADKASLNVWNSISGAWSGSPRSHTKTTIDKLQYEISSYITNYIDSNGFYHALSYAEPSNGITASTIETDFIELEIETNVPYLPIVVNNKGTADAKPIFTAMVKAPITHLDIVTEEGYMRIGEPVNIEETPVEREQLILKETLKTTTGWATANDVDGGSVAGTMVSDGETFRAQSYGTGSLWHGPALKRSLPEQIQDFKVDMYASLKTRDVREAGRLELYFKDINDKTLGKLALKEMLTASDSVHGEARAGSIDGGKFLISTDGATPGVWNQFYGILRFTRIGDRLQAYIAKIDTATGNRHTRWLSKEIIDSQGLFQSKLAQIQIHIGQHGSKAFVQDIGVHEVQVYKINQTTETQIPYIAYPGDIIEIDMIENDIRINGESRMDLKDFGSSFFALQPGENIITYSNYDVVDLRVDWRDPFK